MSFQEGFDTRKDSRSYRLTLVHIMMLAMYIMQKQVESKT